MGRGTHKASKGDNTHTHTQKCSSSYPDETPKERIVQNGSGRSSSDPSPTSLISHLSNEHPANV
eukprot:4859972-Amphidinium_carterae.1